MEINQLDHRIHSAIFTVTAAVTGLHPRQPRPSRGLCTAAMSEVGQTLNRKAGQYGGGVSDTSPVVVAAITCASKRQVGTASLDGAYLCASKQVA